MSPNYTVYLVKYVGFSGSFVNFKSTIITKDGSPLGSIMKSDYLVH